MSKTEWIRCEDRLPEDQKRILFTTDYFVAGHKITVAGRFDSKGNRFIPIEKAPQDEYLTCEIECWTPYPDSSKCKSGWIKCSERLPEHGVHVLVACLVKMFDGVGRYYVCDAFHTEHFTDTCNYDDDIDMEYNEEEDEYYMPPGWWEVIKNWDDYTCVAIEDHVTHWMPLPEPPEVDE